MPYVSAKQRRFMKWKHPEIDAKWKAEGHDYVRKTMRLSEISKSKVRLASGAIEHTPIMRLGANGKYERAGITRQVKNTVRRERQVRTSNNLPPQGARGAEAKAQYLAQRQSAKDLRAAQRSAGMTPRGTQSENMAAEANRKRQAASRQQRSQNQMARFDRKAAEAPAKQEASYRKQLEHEYRNVRMAPNQKQEIAGGAAILGTAGGLVALQRHKVDKAAKDKINTPENRAAVAGGVAGIGASQIALQGGGFGAKKLLAHRRKEALKDPAYRKVYAEEWNKHLHSRGLKTMTQTRAGTPSTYEQRTEAKLHTPKTLKDWRGERALAFKNLNPVRRGVKIGLPVAGGAVAYRSVKRRKEQSQVGKSLVDIKSSLPAPRPKDDRKRKGAATGVGAVAAGTGLATGGIPGVKANRISSDFMSGPLKHRPGNLVRARRGGIFGYRVNAHSTLKDFKLSPEGIKHYNPGEGPAADFVRHAEAGKVAPEEKIISHMKRGRKGSYALLAGGTGSLAYGLHRKKPKEKVGKRDDRRNTAMVAGGSAAAGGSYGAARLLEHQGRKWTKQAAANYGEAQKIVPEIGGATVKPGRIKFKGVTLSRTKVPAVRPDVKAKHVTDAMLSGHSNKAIETAGRLHGKATNQSYFGHVYGTMGTGMRRIALPVGAATAVAGGVGLRRNQQSRVKKAYRPSYFQGSAPTERLSGENQRFRTEVQHQGARGVAVGLGAASTAALGARWAGHKNAPHAMKMAAGAARARGVPKEVVADASAKGARLHRWAAPRRGKLLAASAALSVGGLGANTVARWKKDEITGMSQDLGRAAAGDRGQRASRRVTKGAGTALGIEAAARGGKKLAEMTPQARKKIYWGTGIGTAGVSGTAGTVWSVNRKRRMKRENKALQAGGGLTGPVMKGEWVGVGKAFHGGSNVREYAYLPENIRQDVGYGSITTRRNPMSALDMFASSRIMAASRAQGRIGRRRLTQQAHREMNFAGSRAMLYSPTGRGSVF